MVGERPPRAALFVTCLVDQVYPEVAEATLVVLQRAGVAVDVPAAQTCCGQPAFNAGYWAEARAVAGRNLEVLADAGAVVTPSGSCATMIRHFYPQLFADSPAQLALAERVAARTWELSAFLVDVLGTTDVGARLARTVAVHDACHALRELGVRDQPRALLDAAGARRVELALAERCCGFGGLFAVKLGQVSEAMLAAKVADIQASGAEAVVTCDASCMTQLNGGLSRAGVRCRAIHLAQALAGGPPAALQQPEQEA